MMRRDFIVETAGMASFLAAAAQPIAAGRSDIKITDIKTFVVGVGSRNLVFVKVETDQGIHGIGESYSCGPDDATVATINDFKRWLVGQDPRNIEHLWAMMMNFTRFPGGLVVNAAISGIEHALWDILGKSVGVPVYRLLGGKCRDKIRVYQSAGGAEPKAVADNAAALVGKYGYTAVKMSPHMPAGNTRPYNQVNRVAGERVAAVRSALGKDVDIAVDIHAKFVEVAAPRAWPGPSSRTTRCGWKSRSGRKTWLRWPSSPNASTFRLRAANATIPGTSSAPFSPRKLSILSSPTSVSAAGSWK